MSAVQSAAVSAAHSRFVQRIRRRYEAERALLPPGAPGFETIVALVATLRERGRELPAALRVARQLVLERLAVLDVEDGAPLETVTTTMTWLAEAALELALAQARLDADERYGAAIDADGRPVDLWVIGMGKLGARELNVSSDIDLIYVYEDEGQTTGPRPVSFHEYFAFVAKRLYALVGETTEDGFVFRVDLALRPNGNSGPPVVSLGMLKEYFQVQGREWERFAWLKSRIVAPRAAVGTQRALALRSLVTPFVYRRYLDYGVFEGLRQLHRKIRDEAQRRAAGRPERANDVKLSRGGIREIEFIVQLMQVVRGGQFPEIRTRSTLRALGKLAARGLMSAETAQRLADAYALLRRIEHRIQYLDDQQTHLLPTGDEDLAWIAASLAGGDTGTMLDRLCEARETVAAEFDALLMEGAAGGNGQGRNGCRQCGTGPLPIDSEQLLEKMPPALAERLRHWATQPRVQALRDESRLRLGRLMQAAARGIADGGCTEQAALRFVDWVEPLLRRESYLALLAERPEVQRRLLRLLGLARWPMQYLMRHPGVIDELADARLQHQRFDRESFAAELEERRAAWERAGECDEERLLDMLRQAHHAEVFRTLVRDVEGELTVEQVADDLSALADTMLAITVRWAWSRFRQAHREQPALAVIAYGKLGGKELGYGSDLDVVFLFDDADEADPARAQEIYGAFVRKLITWLTLRTAAGELFDIDTALRPNGNSGLLVTSIASFDRYQVGRGSNTAWTWEHQAITRARCAAGGPALATAFDATRRAVLVAERDPQALREEIGAMRRKVRDAHPVRAGRYDVKHSPGGMMDVEFVVQYLVLAHSRTHPELIGNLGNIALLVMAEDGGLLPAGVGRAAADAYRELRRAQHTARLDEQPTQFEPERLAPQRDAVLALWRAVFGEG
ncbi:bifunctional [glutamate--ammonia ligase]-adenylyl-L-tyrosine phosphorylase/[glutamate--ammonia-ligase] adenylyltransferase [Rubrivivax sp. JA1029]|uniref:bifunctional [glutamate--ammonia ligase]-adenylyl-L-tyrosine phosphorylase/[glutamate--ammonia-ligase] adenylyltransferase n=1 Tax=Rubrivivax sp. JA1029 TaxID=2894193 RepID=UPI001E370AD9|nr:bifunctional [glutamate--ammonia ligase]-adenylyl-L-tyrosine phosphorylase/[glutamate--ammonia-ligase] adenylyltransferase [Rubrivivax sp. JA1029]MCC9648697.1 bifunctional [glutamate--ammonia ligase]-adenylyl-L-tyrosine phosphorylase/[glutamate--ammonia-ligase] adenylyltransferase [Rubrivivax sp. JA1029]